MTRVAVVVPAYEAGRLLAGVIERLRGAVPAADLARIIIVNDGSRDDTATVADVLEASADGLVEVVHRPSNGGYGAAMKDGLRCARQSDAEVVACVHADGQYAPEVLPALVKRLRDDDLDLLQGSRIASGTARSGGMPLYKIVGNALLNQLERRVLALELTDFHSGYLLYSRRSLDSLPFDSLSDSFDFDLEVIAAAQARGFRVDEAPVPTHYGDEVSHLNPITYGLRVLKVMWRYKTGYYA